jgi:plasmid maintenance system antidote protein VapI
MKPEYKMRAQEHLEAITKRAKVINEMLEGQRPVNQAEAIKLSKEIERLVELTTNIVDLS